MSERIKISVFKCTGKWCMDSEWIDVPENLEPFHDEAKDFIKKNSGLSEFPNEYHIVVYDHANNKKFFTRLYPAGTLV